MALLVNVTDVFGGSLTFTFLKNYTFSSWKRTPILMSARSTFQWNCLLQWNLQVCLVQRWSQLSIFLVKIRMNSTFQVEKITFGQPVLLHWINKIALLFFLMDFVNFSFSNMLSSLLTYDLDTSWKTKLTDACPQLPHGWYSFEHFLSNIKWERNALSLG